jgi:LL-diaminopimelate aminotransferase
MRSSSRLERIPPYLFAELERKVSAKRAAGIDVISLGIGDPDTPTYAPIVAAGHRAIDDPSTHQYPSNRGRQEFREALTAFYSRRFGVELDPDTEVMPAIGAKECIFNLNLAFLDPGDVALAADPGYPVYTGGPIMAGGEPVLMPLVPELGFVPDLDAIAPEHLERARLMFINYPNNPTGAIVPDGFFEQVIELAARHDILVVHDNAYSEITFDGYVAPSFLATPGAKEVGVEVFSLSKGYNMTGWRCAAIVGNAEAIKTYWRLKSNIDSGNFEAVQLAGAAALQPGVDGEVRAMSEVYRRRRDLVCDALAQAGVDVTPPKGTIYIWAPIPDGFESSAAYCEHVLEQTAVVISPGGAYGASGEGFFRISLTTPEERLLEAVKRIRQLNSASGSGLPSNACSEAGTAA